MLTFQGERSLVETLALSADGRFLAAGGAGRNGVVLLWTLSAPTLPPVALRLSEGEKADELAGAVLEISHLDDGRLAAVSQSGAVLITDPAVPGRTERHFIDPGLVTARLHTNRRLLAVYPSSLVVRRIESDGVRPAAWAAVRQGTTATAVGTTADSNQFAIGLALPAGTHRPRFAVHRLDGDCQFISEVATGSGRIGGLDWSPCGRFLAGVIGARLVVWDADGTQVAELEAGGTRLFRGPRFHPSGRFLAAGGANVEGGVYCWDPVTWREIVGYRWPVGPVMCVAFSPDGTLAAAGGEKGQVTVWDVDG